MTQSILIIFRDRRFTLCIKVILVLMSLLINSWAIFNSFFTKCTSLLSGCPEMPWDIIPIIVSFGFLWVGINTLFDRSSFSTTAYFTISSIVFTTGLTSGLGSIPGKMLFYFGLSLLAPFIFDFNISWSLIKWDKVKKYLLLFLYGFTFLWSVLLLINPTNKLPETSLVSLTYLGIKIEFVFAVILVIVIFLINLNKKGNTTERHRIRLIIAGVILSLLPLILFSLLPNLLGFHYVPTEASFLFLIFIPLTYNSSTHLNSKYWIGKRINRGIYYYLIIVLIFAGYLLLVELFTRLIPSWDGFWAKACSVICILLIFVLNRVDQVLDKLVYWVLNGNEKYYLELVVKMSDELGLVLNRDILNKILVNDLVEIMQLSACALFLKNEKGISLYTISGFEIESEEIVIQENCALIEFLKETKIIIDDQEIHNKIKLFPKSLNILIQSEKIKIWVPLISADELYGFLVMGHFPQDYLMSANDLKVLQVFAHQAGVACHNIQLMEDLHKKTSELAFAHQQLLFARENESRHIANKLHDNSIQELLGISYQLAELNEKIKTADFSDSNPNEWIVTELDSTRQHILQATSELRNLVGELRPAGLEEFGLCKAIEGYIYKVRNNFKLESPHINFSSKNIDNNLSDEISICIFRVAQQAINNSIQHAHAKNINISLLTTENSIVLQVTDDGCGFQVPKWNGDFSKANHFGILGMTERVSWVGGQISIYSKNGQGTKIIASVPLKQSKLIERGNLDQVINR